MAVRDIVRKVYSELPHGRIASWESASETMLRLFERAPVGDHLEIGVLHGGTIIMSALMLEHLHRDVKVIGIDPLDGYYPQYCMHPDGVRPHPKSERVLTSPLDAGNEVSLHTTRKNFKHFGVDGRIAIVQSFSIPWPQSLFDQRFATAYIDGDHYGEAPLIDWFNVEQRIRPGGIVWFDDCNEHCPAIQRACEVASRTPGWRVLGFFENHTYALRKEQ